MIFAPIRNLKVFKTSLLAVLLLAQPVLVFFPVREVHAASNSLVIYQLQTGPNGASSQEYISIKNQSLEDVDITNWCVFYSSSTDLTQTKLVCFETSDKRTRLILPTAAVITLATSDFNLVHQSYKPDFTFTPGIASTSGHIKLLDENQNLVDKVGWGNALSPEGSAIPAAGTAKILQRVSNTDKILKDTDNNSTDFIQTELIVQAGGAIYERLLQLKIYDKLPIINELMPNPIGSDSGHEFIELYNPFNEDINLKDFMIQLGPTYSKAYTFKDIFIKSKSYMLISDKDIGFSMPNTSGSIRLLDPNGDFVQETATYNEIGEGRALIYSSGDWQSSYMPTPGTENILQQDKPCPIGQIRNPDSGYCKNISSSTEEITLKSCDAGQERNLLTGRCRKIQVVSITLCKVGQVRNPETGRCRNVAATNEVKPCPTGQVRSPETNRCKKSALSGASPAKVEDVQSPLIKNSFKWWFAGTTAAGSASYAVYEWRRDLSRLWQRLIKA